METTDLGTLLARIAGEYAATRSIYGIPEEAFMEAFALEAKSPGLPVMGKRVSLPVGPAAGPHTQIAPNIVASYLAGSRVFELKTVQQNDALEIDKPCIMALDEGHNTEWSTELSLDEARGEYLRGWIAVNLLAAIWSSKPTEFVFNMSVGYTLDGIKGERMDAFIEGMRAPSSGATAAEWKGMVAELAAFTESAAFAAAFGETARAKVRALAADVPASPVHSVTLSTMHGCPPAEIERIGRYLIAEKGFDVFVKLNPTLLGYDEARGILDATGWNEVVLTRGNFEHDLQWEDALSLIKNLRECAGKAGRQFGVKLSNTLANANDGSFLPGGERYMSGRSLFPLTVRLAARLAEAVPDFPRRFSYCGGASVLNARDLIEAGAGPITIATDILKPGGYLRMIPVAREAAAALASSPAASAGDGAPDGKKLAALAAAALARPEYRKEWKNGKTEIAQRLPAFDCFHAPCVQACPAKQRAPNYIAQGAAGKFADAMATILADNSLPFTTGVLCDHVCQPVCARNDYEGPVEIRAAKLAVVRTAEASGAMLLADRPVAAATALKVEATNFKVAATAFKAAVIGAGPAGLACAHRLALEGVPVTVFDKSSEPGGTPANVIPRFRIARAELASDVERIRKLGVKFLFKSKVSSVEELRAQGFTAVFVGSGAPVPRELPLSGSGVRVMDALEFLEASSAAEAAAAAGAAGAGATGPGSATSPFVGIRHLVVAGGGNTAMDAVRVASRIPGIKSVALSYRRTRAEMPADKEEFGIAMEEAAVLAGAVSDPAAARSAILLDLTLPESARPGTGGTAPVLRLRRMTLGGKDASGRRAPLPSAETFELPCDLLVAAVGEVADRAWLEAAGIKVGADGRPEADAETLETTVPDLYIGGDARRGPASIIAAEADGNRAAYAMMAKAGIRVSKAARPVKEIDRAKLARRGELLPALPADDPRFLEREAERCLNCGTACLRCAEVCPNRANFAVPVASFKGGDKDSPFRQQLQILHVDYLCNECGNCGLFCPFQDEPYRHKPTLFNNRSSLDRSKNAGFVFLPAATAEPSIAYRAEYEGVVREASWTEWNATAADPLLVLAKTVLTEHSYLIGGRA